MWVVRYGAQRASPAFVRYAGATAFISRLSLQSVSRFCVHSSWQLKLVSTCCPLIGARNLAPMSTEGKENDAESSEEG